MRKLFILSLLAMMIAWGISGCGGGVEGTSADPLGTDSIMFEDAAGSAAPQVNPKGALALKATVKNAAGTAVVRREVSFGFVSNASGATLTSYSANTNGAGEATILYRAGATAGSDVVRASISNGATMDVSITIAGTAATTTTYTISVSALPSGIVALEGQSVVEATVEKLEVGSSGLTITTPVSGVTVNFIVIAGGTGLGSVSPGSAITDGSGKAVTTYRGGAVVAGSDYTDVVQASFTIGGMTYSNAVQIDYWPPLPLL